MSTMSSNKNSDGAVVANASGGTTIESATKAVEIAKEQISACDQQNGIYKAALRNLTNHVDSASSASSLTSNNNTVSIEWIKVCLSTCLLFVFRDFFIWMFNIVSNTAWLHNVENNNNILG
jgi:3-oxoacyl-ACP reductase-like protein